MDFTKTFDNVERDILWYKFIKIGRFPANLKFNYKGSKIDIVDKFCYLGIVFTSGGSSSKTQRNPPRSSLKSDFYFE